LDPAAIERSDGITFCCPSCRGSVASDPAGYHCPRCQRRYPIVCGIPDFRLAPDPYISFEDEYDKARQLAKEAERASFEALVRFYWKITPDVPHQMAERFIRYALNGADRAEPCLATMDAEVGGRWTGARCLDVGCGTGGFLAAARERFGTLVGADIALRWLVVARKRLVTTGYRVALVCCSAEALPFLDGTFDAVAGMHVLEHAADPQAILSETVRVLKAGGRCYFSTPNRFSLGPELTVRAWGVGYIPRSWANRYVRLMKGISYRNIRVLSCFEVRRMGVRAGLTTWSLSSPRLAECEQQTLSAGLRRVVQLYHLLQEVPIVRRLLVVVGPLLQVVGQKHA
jgi:ubiquinone/menaquinone biosynthesis C-methylase UbiE/uncharacterized protein YbaR (Trm112 family)